MLLLLDENLPKRLKSDFPNHQIFTVWEKGWNGIKNGELLQLLLTNDFDALITFDKNLQHQQNFLKYPITVFVLNAINNTYIQLKPLTSVVNDILAKGAFLPVHLLLLKQKPTLGVSMVRSDGKIVWLKGNGKSMEW